MKKELSQKGFTLIEVLIAVVLLGVISLLTWQAMGSSLGAKERFENREQVVRGVNLVMNRLNRDLTMAVLFASPEFLGISSNGEQASKSVFIGTNSGDQDKLTFDTLSHMRYLKDTKESDLSEVTYFLDRQEDGDAGLYVLKKREKSPLDTEPGENGNVMTLLEGVKELNFRYYDPTKTEYKDEWDTTKVDYVNKLPRAVEITLVVQDPNDDEASLRYMTLVLLEMAPGPSDF